jgi:hypothetical protein
VDDVDDVDVVVLGMFCSANDEELVVDDININYDVN